MISQIFYLCEELVQGSGVRVGAIKSNNWMIIFLGEDKRV